MNEQQTCRLIAFVIRELYDIFLYYGNFPGLSLSWQSLVATKELQAQNNLRNTFALYTFLYKVG